jgi:hypothetical protein
MKPQSIYCCLRSQFFYRPAIRKPPFSFRLQRAAHGTDGDLHLIGAAEQFCRLHDAIAAKPFRRRIAAFGAN